MSRSIAVSSPRGERRGIRGRSLATLTTSLLTLGLAVLLACAGPGDGGTVADDRDLLELIPGDVSMVIWGDLAGFRSVVPEEGTPLPFLHGEAGTRFPGDLDREKLAELREKTGIDLHQDVHEFATGIVVDTGEADPARGDLISVLRVDYDRARLSAYLEGQPTLEYRGHTLHRLPPGDLLELVDDEAEGPENAPADDAGTDMEDRGPEGRADGDPGREGDGRGPAAEAKELPPDKLFYVVLLDAEHLLAGTPGGIRSSLDLRAGEGTPLTGGPGIGDLLSRLPDERQILVAVGGNAFSHSMREEIPDRSPVPKKALANLRSAGLAGHVSADLVSSLTVVGLADTADNAKLLKESVQGMVALGKMMLQQQEPEVLEIVDRAVTVEQDGAEVRLQLRLTEEDGETLGRFAAERMGKPLPHRDEAGGEDEGETG